VGRRRHEFVSPAVTIRRAEPTDADSIYQVMRQSRRDAFGGLLPQAALDWDAETPESFREFVRETVACEENAMWVALRDGAVVGVVELAWHQDATAGFVEASGAEVKSIHVRPPHRNEGIGSSLLDESVGSLPPEVTGLSLCVLAENDQARAFYERRGFERTGTTTTTHAAETVTEVVYHRPR
jgi:ribosomal protein S18 acetylase RimI-like enzyme